MGPKQSEAQVVDRIVFGDNQFFGVNHMSEEKARAQAMRFQRIDAIVDVLDAAHDAGIRAFMCTTHERVADICHHVRQRPERYLGFQFYPCMPYAHKYANAVTEHGMLEALTRLLPDSGKLQAVVKGGMSLAGKDIEGLGQLLIDAEMKTFAGLQTPIIFLQNVVTDLLLGLGLKDGLRMFAEHVRTRYRARPGFITMNLPWLVQVLDELGLDDAVVCANINKIGFRMCGGIERYERVLRQGKYQTIAMSVFASGAIPAREALEWVCRQTGVHAVVFGASSALNIRQTKALLHEFWNGAPRGS